MKTIPQKKFPIMATCILIAASVATLAVTSPRFVSSATAGISGIFWSTGTGDSGAQAYSTFGLLNPVVTTDKSDYAPGQTVNISGLGFSPGEQVRLRVVDLQDGPLNDTDPAHQPWTVAADPSGNFTATWVVDPDSLNHSLLLTADGLTSGLHAEVGFTDTSIGTYDQCSNDKGTGYTTGDTGCRWINGNLNGNNSTYFEGDATVQRLWLTGLDPGSSHTVTFTYDTTKGGKHAYDYLTTWDYSENWITTADLCQDITGCVTAYSTKSLRDITDDPNVPNVGTPNGIEPIAPGSRQFTMAGGSLTVVSTPTISSGSYSSDSETSITITFNVGPSNGAMCSTNQNATTCGVAVWFGAHISKSSEWRKIDGHGGAATISGSPYHVALDKLDGASIGQRDNQMVASAVIAPASITIIKDATPNGSTSFPFTASPSPLSNFSLVDDGTSANTKVFSNIVNFQSYSIAETVPTGWKFDGASCQVEADSSNGGSATAGLTTTINLAEGENWTCTYLDSQQQGNIIVDKVTVPSGSSQSFTFNPSWGTSFPLTDAATPVDSGPLAAGTYSVSETAVSGWDLTSSTCTSSLGQAAESPSSIHLDPNETVTCTFTNTQRGNINIVKTSVGGTGTFGYTASGTGVSNFSIDTGSANPGTKSFTNLTPGSAGGSRTFTETVPTGWKLTGLSCTSALGTSTTSTSSGTATVSSLGAGDTVTCSYQDTKQGQVIVKKVMVGGTDTFTYTGTPNGSISTNNGTISAAVDPGQYTSTEAAKTGWDLTSISCDDGASTTASTGDVGTRTATFNIEAGETVTCTFTNTKQATVKLIKNTTGGNDTFNYATSGALVGQGSPAVPNPLSVTTSGSASGGTGQSAVYTFSNLPAAGSTLSFDETQPSGWSFVSASVSGDADSTITGDVVNLKVNPGETVVVTYNNSRPDMSIAIAPQTATNEVGKPHTFTVTVTQIPNGAAPASSVDIVTSVTPTPNLANTTTCGPGISFSGGLTASCTITINNSTAGTFTANASATANVGGVSLTRSTSGNSGPGGSGAATKNYVDARISLSPPTATNAVGQQHVITATVQQNTGGGFVAAPDGTVVSFSLANNAAGATFVGPSSCTTTGGTCTVTIVASNPGGVDIHGTTTLSVGGVTLTRATGDGLSGDGSDVHKNYVTGSITIAPTATNEVGQQHTFTVTVTQAVGAVSPATTANVVVTIAPAGYQLVSSDCNSTVPFAGLTATCHVTINSSTAGQFSASATASFTVDGVPITATTDSTGSNSGPAVKTYVDASLALTPQAAENAIGLPHIINANVTKNDGLPAGAPGGDAVTGTGPASGVTVNFTLTSVPPGATFVGGGTTASCTTDVNGACSVQINSLTAGTVSVSATTTFSIGGVSLTRSTGDSKSGDSGNAIKVYVNGNIVLSPLTATNNVGQPHTITATVTQDDGLPAGATGGDAVTGPGPAPNGTLVTFTLLNNTAGATFTPGGGTTATCNTSGGVCSVTINSNTPGGVDIHATTTFSVLGQSLTRATGDTFAGDSVDAHKDYVAAQLRIKKLVVPSTDTTSFSFTPTGWNGDTNFNLTNGQTKASGPIPPGGPYTAAENVPSTFALTNIACVRTGTSTSFAFTPVTNGVSVTLGVNDDVTCTFTNSRLPTLILKKTIMGSSDTFHFAIGGGVPNPNIDLTPAANSSVQSSSQVIQPGSYTVDEVNLAAGWMLTDATCTSNNASGTFSFLATTSTGGTFSAGYGDNVLCAFDNEQQLTATRTQGFWATHSVLSNAIWNGTALPSGTSTIPATPVIGSADAKLCTANDITAIPAPGQNQLLGGFWAGISQLSAKGGKRSPLDQARMQLLQQYFAAVLNVHAFGTAIPGTTLATARAAYCGTDQKAISIQQGLLGAYNSMGDNVSFIPGTPATTAEAKSEANIPFWDITFR